MRVGVHLPLASAMLAMQLGFAHAFAPMMQDDGLIGEIVMAQARSCKAVRSCEEAVILWCSGYRRADGDNDGIPCENVCRTKREVDEIRERIGC